MFKIFQQLKTIKHGSFFKFDNKTQQPLLNSNEILELLFRVKSQAKSRPYNNEVAFKQSGDVRSIYRGYGMDYEESRRYQPGDDPRYMNWPLSARTGQQYIKVFREERQPGVFILMDRRHSMRFGTQQRLKVTQAARVAALAAFSAQEKNYSIGGVILDDKVEWFKENKSKQAVFNFIHQASRPAPPLFEKQIDEPNINEVLLMLNEVLTTGSTVYLISDFHDLNESSQSILLKLSSEHEIHAVQISDLSEIKLPKAGNITLKSSAFSKKQQLNSSSSRQQDDYQSAANEYFSIKRSLFYDIAILYEEILTHDNDIHEKVTF